MTGVISQENLEKARNYNIDKTKFGFVSGLWSQVLSTVILTFNIIPGIWLLSRDILDHFGLDLYGETYQTLVFMVVGSLISEILNLPWSIYSNFVIEERHGFNKYTPGFYAKDRVKKFLVSQTIFVPIVSATIYIIRAGGEYFFFYLWVFCFFVMIALMTIYPDFIAPLFDKFTPLPEGELRNKIEELASQIDFPLKKLYVVEGSKRSSHSNAYFFGFYKNKRIVLFDTLIEGYENESSKEDETDDGFIHEKKDKKRTQGCTTNEVVAVLAHELGHWSLNHVAKNLAISEVNLFFTFAVFGLLFQNDLIYASFGFPLGQKPVFLGLIIILQYIFSPYNELLSFLLTCLSRQFEFQADAFAKSLHKTSDLRAALIKLNHDNLSFPIYDNLYSMWNHSHPPLLERLAALAKSDWSLYNSFETTIFKVNHLQFTVLTTSHFAVFFLCLRSSVQKDNNHETIFHFYWWSSTAE